MFPLKAITNHVFVVTLRGENVFHECSLFCFIRDIQQDEIIKTKWFEKYGIREPQF